MSVSGCCGCDFSKFEPSILASACDDGTVRVWDVSVLDPDPIVSLKGHTAKVFNVAFSPFFAERLCSSSDDNTVRCVL